MHWTLLLQAVGIVFVGTILLRIAGRKSISQMTIAQVVVMIGLGTLLIQPIAGKGYWMTFVLGAVLVLSMRLMEFLEIKADWLETLITGKSVVVIENGKLNQLNMRKLRLTTDKLEMRLRQVGISSLSDVEWATIEVSGNVGYQLKPAKQPATKGDLQKLINLMEANLPGLLTGTQAPNNIFSEIVNEHQTNPHDKLQ